MTVNTAQTVEQVLALLIVNVSAEIISRRLGLTIEKKHSNKSVTSLGITRERVRQLEKAILIRLKLAAEKDADNVQSIEKHFIRHHTRWGCSVSAA